MNSIIKVFFKLFFLFLILLILISPSVNWLSDVEIVRSDGLPTSYSYEEYQAALWIKETVPNSVIISDPYTQLVFSGISGSQHVGEEYLVGNARKLIKEIIKTPYAHTAYNSLKFLINQNINLNYSEITSEDIFQQSMVASMRGNRFNFSISDKNILIVVSSRTMDWGENEELWEPVLTNSYLWENMFPSISNISISEPNFLKFLNEAYFDLIYLQDQQIYVFKMNSEEFVNQDYLELENNSTVVFDEFSNDWTLNPVGVGNNNFTIVAEENEKIIGNFSLKVDIASGSFEQADLKLDFDVSKDWSNNDVLCMYIYGFNDDRLINVYLLTPDWSNGARFDIIDNWIGWARFELPLHYPVDDFGLFELSNVKILFIANACENFPILLDRIVLDTF